MWRAENSTWHMNVNIIIIISLITYDCYYHQPHNLWLPTMKCGWKALGKEGIMGSGIWSIFYSYTSNISSIFVNSDKRYHHKWETIKKNKVTVFSSIFKNMRQYRLWGLIFIFSRKNTLMVMTSLEDTPMSNICNRSSIEVKETILKH